MLKKEIKAFSLIELLVVFTIATILITSAVALMDTDKYTEENQVLLISDLIKTSRITSLRDNKTVIICSSYDRENCNTNSLWQGKYIISFISDDGSNSFDVINDTLVRVVETSDSRYYYHWDSFPSSSYIKIISRGNGMNGVLTFCNVNSSYSRVSVNSSGNVSIEDPTDDTDCTA